jgi:hypothetical protein
MATEILATASTAASSSDVVVTTAIAVSVKGVADGEAYVTILLKDDGAAYDVVGSLTSHSPATVISAPGTYRFTRRAGAACGVFSG